MGVANPEPHANIARETYHRSIRLEYCRTRVVDHSFEEPVVPTIGETHLK